MAEDRRSFPVPLPTTVGIRISLFLEQAIYYFYYSHHHPLGPGHGTADPVGIHLPSSTVTDSAAPMGFSSDWFPQPQRRCCGFEMSSPLGHRVRIWGKGGPPTKMERDQTTRLFPGHLKIIVIKLMP